MAKMDHTVNVEGRH